MRIPHTAEWMVTTTVQSNRRNLFDVTPGHEHQIATLISGSSTNIDRFDRSMSLIKAAPKMHEQLCKTIELLRQYNFVQNPMAHELRHSIQDLLGEIETR